MIRYPSVRNLDATKLPAVRRWLDGDGDSALGFDRVMTLFNDNREAFAKLYGKRHQQFTSEFRFDIWRLPHDGLNLWVLTAKSKGTAYEVEPNGVWKPEDEYKIISFLSDLYDELKAREEDTE